MLLMTIRNHQANKTLSNMWKFEQLHPQFHPLLKEKKNAAEAEKLTVFIACFTLFASPAVAAVQKSDTKDQQKCTV